MAKLMKVTPETTGVCSVQEITPSSADLVSRLLQKNHTNYHVYWNKKGGYHNHQAHYLLTAYALGANTEQLQIGFDSTSGMQRAQFPVDRDRIAKMDDVAVFKSMLGDDHYFQDFLAFFQLKIEKADWKKVVNEYLLSGSDLADDLLTRMYAGIWHPLILFGFGVEFEQPLIVAESLAGAACHSDAYAAFLFQSERLSQQSELTESESLMKILQSIVEDPALYDAEHWHGGNSYNDGIISNAPDNLVKLVSQWRVHGPSDLPFKTAEMINVNAYIAGTAQRRNKIPKVDFIFMHQVNVSIFFSVFNEQNWISSANKIRLLEWQTRMDLLNYAANLAPKLSASEIVTYKAGETLSTWSTVVKRANDLVDDGHVPKFIRAVMHGSKVSESWETTDPSRFPMQGAMWLQLANMVIDSTESAPNIFQRWVRGAGNDKAWSIFPDRTLNDAH